MTGEQIHNLLIETKKQKEAILPNILTNWFPRFCLLAPDNFPGVQIVHVLLAIGPPKSSAIALRPETKRKKSWRCEIYYKLLCYL